MYIPYDLKENKCFSIGEMLKSDSKKFSALKKVSSVLTDKREPRTTIFSDSDEKEKFKSLAGLAVIEAIPGFKYKCGKEPDLVDLVLEKGKGILLTVDCCLQFEPKDPKNIKGIFFKAHGFDGSNNQITSKTTFNLADLKSNNSFSHEVMTANVLKESCEGILGEECAKVVSRCPGDEVMEGK